MDSADLDVRDLLVSAPRGGWHRFATLRTFLLHQDALSAFREQLVRDIGPTEARALLMKLGCVWGWTTASGIKAYVPWTRATDWSEAWSRLPSLVGLGTADSTTSGAVGQVLWRDSPEADAHVKRHGISPVPVCWTLAGFAAGYLSCATGAPVVCREDECVAMGHAACVFVTTRDDGDAQDLTHHCAPAITEAAVTDAEASGVSDATAAVTDEAARSLGIYSPPMLRVLSLATRIAPLDSTVLIAGESGVGKERLAHHIHENSRRNAGPFVAINCGALAETLLESELFGHARGAFTGAHADREGLFEAANRGTLFLDEIGEMPLAMQVKLLRVLQEREVRRVGENKPRRINVRLVAATNRNLEDEVAAGRFRGDLYYRLRVVDLYVPPLRERPDDVRALARVLLATAARQVPCNVTGFTPPALEAVLRYHWPGNVRELENAIERACALARGPLIDVDDLPVQLVTGTSLIVNPVVVRPLADIERDYIVAALDLNHGNKTQAAAQLGIAPATLFRKLRRYARSRKATHSL